MAGEVTGGELSGEGVPAGEEIDEEPKKRRAVDPNMRVLIRLVLVN